MADLISDGGSLNNPRDFVQSGWDYFRGLSSNWIEKVNQSLGDLSGFNIQPISWTASYDLSVDYGNFIRPIAPDVPDLGTINVTLPNAPAVVPVSKTDIGSAPAEPDFSGLVYNPPAPPTAVLPTAPLGLDVVLDPIAVPDAPSFVLPPVPTMYSLNLPDAPQLVLPTFLATPPVFNIPVPDTAFNWHEVAYSSATLDAVKSHLQDMMNGGLGLPPAIEQAIFDRGRSRSDALSLKRVQEVAEDLGSRGLHEPAGYLARRLDAAREEGRAESAGTNKDVTIEVTKIQVESIRFAIQQAGALEIALLQQNGEINARALQAAKIGSDIQVNVFNALVARFNLDVDLFKANAEVYRDQIQAALAVVEMYKAQIDAQSAIGQINESLIRAYTAQVGAVQTMAEVYRTQVEAAKVKGELNLQKLEQVKTKVQVFSAEVDAWRGAQEGYKIQVDAALGGVRVYEAIGGVYGQRVQAYRVKGEQSIADGQFQIATQALGFEGFRNALEGAKALIAEQSAIIDAKARTFDAQAKMYVAEGQVVSAESDAHNRTAALRIENAKEKVDVDLKNAEMRIQQNEQLSTIYVEQLKSKAQILAQLAASTMSGVSFGASYGGSLSSSHSQGTSLSYSGEAPDWTGSQII